MNIDLTNKVVLITGGTGGLGLELSRQLVSKGAKVIAIDLHTVSYESNADILYIAADITNIEAVDRAVSLGIETFGKIDILINNAGITHMSKFEDTSLDLVKNIMDVNFIGSVIMTKACFAQLIQNKGQIIAISSVAGFAPLYARAAYSASKHAMEGFFRSISAELQDQQVKVTIVCPSFVNTRPELQAQVNNGVSSPGATKKSTNGEVMPTSLAAKQIIKTISSNKPTLLLGRVAKVAFWLFHLLPNSYLKIMTKGAKKEFDV